MVTPSGYTFPILDSSGNPTSTVVDMADMFVRKELFLDANLWAWGGNSYGQLGNGTYTINYSSPVQVGSLTNWKQINGGNFYIFAIKTDGSLWTWGYNMYGGMGISPVNVAYSSPIQIGSLSNWKQVSTNYAHTATIKTDGTLWTWGYNNIGQLGNNTITMYSSPIQIGSLTNWKQISVGQNHSVAIKTDGTLWSWGYNGYGQMGNGTIINYSSPIQVGSLTNWKYVSCGFYFSFVIKTDGTLWGCGQNNYGQLGNGINSVNYSSPIQIGILNNWKQISAGYQHAAAVKNDGTLWTWGWNNGGQLGNGTVVNYSSPIQVGSLTNWKQVSCGYYTTAVKTDGTVWTWGWNNNGQLGNGNTIGYSSPIQVGSLTNWKQVFCDSYNTFAISSPDLP